MKKSNIVMLGAVLLLGAVAVWLWQHDSKGTLAGNPFTEFAISDTAQVGKIFITDAQGQSVTLQRAEGERLWNLDGKYKARKDAVDLLLRTFLRMRVRSNVPLKAEENMIKLLASAGKKVEVYDLKGKWIKTYYVGTPTPDHNGTIMLLELPRHGRGERPYIVYMEGFTGFLSTRFHADQQDWRYTGIFEFPKLEDLQKVEVWIHNDPAQSFSIIWNGGNDLQLMAEHTKQQIAVFDTLMAKDFLLRFKKVHLESYNSRLNPFQQDSLKKLPPPYVLAVTSRSGKRSQIDLYLKPAVKDVYDENGQRYAWDLDNLYGVTDEGEVVSCQAYVFDPLLRRLKDFLSSGAKELPQPQPH